MNWYALFVESGKEEAVQQFLRRYFDPQLLRSCVPKRRIPEKKSGIVCQALRKFFPGYVLIRTRMDTDIFYQLKTVPGCFWLVNSRPYYTQEQGVYYSRIGEHEINPLLQLLDESDIVDYSRLYIENSKVSVVSGPLRGKENIIKKVDRHKNRAKILLNFLGKEATFDVGVEIVHERSPSLY